MEDRLLMDETDHHHGDAPRIVSFSQPIARPVADDFEYERGMEQVSNTQLARRGLFVDLFPSAQITRFSSSREPEMILQRLADAFQECLVPCKMTGPFKV